MSLSSSRLNLIHRVTVQRDANAGDDNGHGNPPAPDWQDLSTLQCRAWVDTGNGPNDEQASPTDIRVRHDRRMIVPVGTDITELDRVGDVTSRGVTILDGPMGVQAVLFRRDHLEVCLRRIS